MFSADSDQPTSSTQPRDGRYDVLVIAAGGFICLKTEQSGDSEGLVRASISEIQESVMISEASATMVLHEVGMRGVRLHVDFLDLRSKDGGRIDPVEQDSSQVNPGEWAKIASLVEDKYAHYRGFVLLHGLDTMAYTASALSFMLGGLGKPVVLTGSQRPLNYVRTDAVQNIVSAITFAGAERLALQPIPEVTIYADERLFRGNRATMTSAYLYRSFESTNTEALAVMGASVDVRSDLILDKSVPRKPNVFSKASATVQIIDVFPGMQDGPLRSIIRDNREIYQGLQASSSGDPDSVGGRPASPVRGVVLRTYGLGTAPTDPGFLGAIEELVMSGVVVVNVTQARSGRVSYGTDSISLRLLEHGVVSGLDMSVEAAYSKMVILLSREVDSARVADLMQREFCGEQAASIFNFEYGSGRTTRDSGVGKYTALLQCRREPFDAVLVRSHPDATDVVQVIQLRILGIMDDEGFFSGDEELTVGISLVDRSKIPPDTVGTLVEQRSVRWSLRSGENTVNLSFRVLGSCREMLSSDKLLLLCTNRGISWKLVMISVFAQVDF